jgi:hypothetical protein
MEEAPGYMANLSGGWILTVTALDGECVAWLHHDGLARGWYETVVADELFLDLDRMGYLPTVYHDGGEVAPLVLFHAPQPGRLPYVWEPRSGRVYRAGAPGGEFSTRTTEGR